MVSDSRDIFETAALLVREGTPFVMMTVIGTKGSTPRDAGAKMIWCPGRAEARVGGRGNAAGMNGAELSGIGATESDAEREARALIGTVGGGQFEHLVIDTAEKHLRNRSCGTEQYVLGADADQCCGGVMDVFFEYHGAAHRLVIFGAGHVAYELVEMLAPAAISVVIADDRAAWNSAERFPRCRRAMTWDEGVRLAREHPASTLACVMTCSHDTDFDILRMLLSEGKGEAGSGAGGMNGAGVGGVGGGTPSFVGLIGSRSKRACLFGRLVASGIDEERVQSVQCPIGVGDTGKAPRLVAVSMAAQILLEAKKRAPM